MNILFDMVHPADVHFFKHAIFSLKAAGHKVVVASRQKDVTIELLNLYGICHFKITKKGKGALGLFLELFLRDFKLFLLALKFKPDVYLSNNSPCGSHVAWLHRKPSIVFDDTEIHRHNRRLYYPFVSEVHTPNCYRDNIGLKQKSYNSYHSLAYLHPNHFTPDSGVLIKNEISLNERYVFIRLVSWGAMHDIGLAQLKLDQKLELVREVSKYAKVLISAEGELDDELKQFQVSIPIQDIHHLLAYADLVIGESATMCSEASVLGTFSIYIDDKGRGYTDELEKKYSLCQTYKPSDYRAIKTSALKFLQDGDSALAMVKTNHQKMMEDMMDLSQYQLNQITRLYSNTSNIKPFKIGGNL